jgi:hypothetical protein
MASKTVKVGAREVVLQPFSLGKGLRVLHTVRYITQSVPKILTAWGEFGREYEAQHVTEIERTFARLEYAPRPLMDEEPLLDGEGRAITDQLGQALVRRTPKLIDGVPVMGPDPLGHMSEEDWQASGNRLRIPRSPSTEERVAAIFPMALTLAEEEVSRLLALLSMSNAEVKRAAAGDFPEALAARAEELMDAPAEDLMELAVAAGEMVEEQFMAKVKGLGDRLPNALRLFGMSPKGQASMNSASETNPISSTDSPSPTDGESDELSTEPSGDGSPISASV